MKKTSIGERIMKIRLHLNQTQDDFGKLINITPGQLSKIENGHSEPQKGTIQNIIENTGIEPDWLLYEKGIFNINPARVKKMETLTNPWKDEAYTVIKEENSRLAKEVERLWQLIGSDKKLNFLKALDKAGAKIIRLKGTKVAQSGAHVAA